MILARDEAKIAKNLRFLDIQAGEDMGSSPYQIAHRKKGFLLDFEKVPTWQFWDSGGVKLESLCNFSIVGCQWTVNCLLGGLSCLLAEFKSNEISFSFISNFSPWSDLLFKSAPRSQIINCLLSMVPDPLTNFKTR